MSGGSYRHLRGSFDALAGLDPAQLEAVEHGDGPRGRGGGRHREERVLTARVARLLEAGVVPERILLLTFTRRAASAMPLALR